MKRIQSIRGYTILEMLIALFITGIITATGFQFYVSMHNQSLTQEEISDMQQNVRVTLDELTKTVRMAGYKTGAHEAYHINGDSLYIFYAGTTQPIDTILYFMADHSSYELSRFPDNIQPRKLMKQINSDTASVFAEFINKISYRAISPSVVVVDVQIVSSKPDEKYADNNGFRTIEVEENVTLRNALL